MDNGHQTTIMGGQFVLDFNCKPVTEREQDDAPLDETNGFSN